MLTFSEEGTCEALGLVVHLQRVLGSSLWSRSPQAFTELLDCLAQQIVTLEVSCHSQTCEIAGIAFTNYFFCGWKKGNAKKNN
jgi:hypothetical protein